MSPHGPLTVDGLSFGWPGRDLFTDWSHVFEPGVTWLRADDASGKSTLLRLLGGELRPHEGRIRLADEDLSVDRVAFSGPERPADQSPRPWDFLDAAAAKRPGFDRDLAMRLVDALGLAPFLERRIEQLSTGSARKVGVIAALAAGAPVVLLDDPFYGFDRGSSNVLKERFAALASERRSVVIVASHEPLEGDDIRVLELGQAPVTRGRA